MKRPIFSFRAAFWLCAPLLLTRCTAGALPTNGKLPAADGSALINVNASTINGVPASKLTADDSILGAATDSATASTLVKRDALGNITVVSITGNLNGNASTATSALSANTATTATSATSAVTAAYSLGRMGATIASNPTLTLGNDGNFFVVTGTATISGLSAMPAGSRVTLYFSGAVTLSQSSVLFLSGNGTFTTNPGDFFELLSLGNGTWIELFRNTTRESSLFYRSGASVTLSTTPQPYKYQTVIFDNQLEYSSATGNFTARQQGVYQIDVSYSTDAAIWSNGDTCSIGINYRNTGPLLIGTTVMYSTAGAIRCVAKTSGIVRLNAGDFLTIQVYSSGPAVPTDSSSDPYKNTLSITRLHSY